MQRDSVVFLYRVLDKSAGHYPSLDFNKCILGRNARLVKGLTGSFESFKSNMIETVEDFDGVNNSV